MLVAVTKNANNHILPLAYAVVDEETVESWCWFLRQFREHVVRQNTRTLCVISDRHKGIIHAMNNLPEWKEPYAYHRFCLRHIRSNLMSKFKSVSLKRLCWYIGSTTQGRKYRWGVREMKGINLDAWNYLDATGATKWALAHDVGRRRWDVQQFAKHARIAWNCNTPLPPRMWRMFTERDITSQEHKVTTFDYGMQIYRVVTKLQTNKDGGNDYTVQYKNRKCTCGKWQTLRFPCSHAIVVCHLRGEDPHDIVSRVHTTATYRELYDGHFNPINHQGYWTDPGWRMIGDSSKFITSVGRRRQRRIQNEMDAHHPDEDIIRRCGLCNGTGHNRSSCLNSYQ
ncbi:uncharacterized protein LOC143581536 [Bidens hawaiensis]|uniref:uncharacterized protein LOC143581536 n=1 Tax=Bidens hawaiensis TaxID=980011 RepID=UPI0040497A18